MVHDVVCQHARPRQVTDVQRQTPDAPIVPHDQVMHARTDRGRPSPRRSRTASGAAAGARRPSGGRDRRNQRRRLPRAARRHRVRRGAPGFLARRAAGAGCWRPPGRSDVPHPAGAASGSNRCARSNISCARTLSPRDAYAIARSAASVERDRAVDAFSKERSSIGIACVTRPRQSSTQPRVPRTALDSGPAPALRRAPIGQPQIGFVALAECIPAPVVQRDSLKWLRKGGGYAVRDARLRLRVVAEPAVRERLECRKTRTSIGAQQAMPRSQ